MTERDTLGQEGEIDAAHYLASKGLHVVARRYRTRQGEIDLIARDRGTWVFVEVKTRRSRGPGFPSAVESITAAKRARLTKAALGFMKKRRLQNQPMRFDVVLVENDLISWIPNAFEPSSYFTY